jgi:hypothetical protein
VTSCVEQGIGSWAESAERVEPPAQTLVNIGRLTAGHLALIVPIVLAVGIGLYFIRRGSDRPADDASAAPKSIPVTTGHSQVDYTGSAGGGLLDDGMGPRGTRVAPAILNHDPPLGPWSLVSDDESSTNSNCRTSTKKRIAAS